MEWHHPRKRSQKQCPQPVRWWEVSFGMLQDAYWSSFCHKWKPSMLLVTFRHSTSCAVHCITNVHGKNHPATQHTVPYHFSMCGETFKRTDGNFSPIHHKVWTEPPRTIICLIFKESDARQVLCNEWGSPDSHQWSFMNCWNRVLQNGDFVEIIIQCTYLTDMVFFLLLPLLNPSAWSDGQCPHAARSY
jgi:hypothetical protein